MLDVSSTLAPVGPQPDRWLMQTVLLYSSSDAARDAAAAWLTAYATALDLGFDDGQAHLDADSAYRAAATHTGLLIDETANRA